MKISVNVPSYKRPIVKTLNYLPFATVWVSESQKNEYVKNNPKADIVTMPDEVQGNISRVRNYILDNSDSDAVVIMDDDYTGLFYWEQNKKKLVEPDEFKDFIEKYSEICKQWGAKMWGVNINQDKQIYRENAPFSTTNFIGGPFGVFLKENECRYDERIPLKEDYDMTIQQLNKYRRVLRLNKFFYIVKQAEQIGGVAQIRNFKNEQKQLSLLQKKWGSEIVRIDNNNRSHNLTKEKNKIDFNPVIRVPIKGI